MKTRLTGTKQIDSGMMMNKELYLKVQAELGKTKHHVCGEDIGAILVSDEVMLDYDSMRVYRGEKYIADILPIQEA